ncbi:MAG: hypothetical protein HY454_02465 [Parcubacteria group bacterium]|nr:hypothetical protein [Parcubacteria group bacterium]
MTIFSKEEVVAQTNVFRKTLGLSELKESPTLDTAAAQKLEDMKQNQYFAHNGPDGTSPWYWIEINGYKYSYAGENLAIGFYSAKDTVDAWINSPTHRTNLANSNYKEIGIAVAPAKIQNSEGYLIVQLFGTPKPTIVPRPARTPAPSPPVVTTVSPPPVQIAQLKPATTQAIPPPTELSYQPSQEITTPVVSTVVRSTPELRKFGQILNTSFILYTLFAFLISVVLLIFKEAKKGLVIRSAASLALLVLAIVVPIIQVSRTALIF